MPTTGPTPDELLSALAAESARQAEQLDTVVRGLAADVARLVQDRAEVPVIPCWVDMDAETAAQAWGALRVWVTTVLVVRYPHVATSENSNRVVPPCWYRHPFIVEELSALWVAWCAVYRDPAAAPTTATTWHKLLSEACSRLSQHGGCTSEHEDDTVTTEPVDDQFDAFVMADVMSRPDRSDTHEEE